MKLSSLLLASWAALALSACESPSPTVNGTGYGAGIPRTTFILRGEPNEHGGTTLGFPDPAHPPESTQYGQAPLRPSVDTRPLIVQAAPIQPPRQTPTRQAASGRTKRRPSR
jgi:hypothetical protein